MRIVLASESQFRKRAMDLLGLPYETRPSQIDEKAIRDDDPAQLTRKLAEAKAQKIAAECPDAIIVSGDAVAAKSCQNFHVDEHPEKVPKFALKIEPWYVLTVGRAMTLRWPLGTIMDDLKHGRKKERTAKNLPMRSNEWCVGPVAIGRQGADPPVRSASHLGRAGRHVRGPRPCRRSAHERLFPRRLAHSWDRPQPARRLGADDGRPGHVRRLQNEIQDRLPARSTNTTANGARPR